MKIDVVASEWHYLAHMLPIWNALPDHLRGTVHPVGPVGRPPMGRIAMVAGWQDVAPLRTQCPMIYVEHGAGQTYVDRLHDPSYSGSGGNRHIGVIGYIAPSETVAARWQSAPSVAVGCPKMDAWLGVPRSNQEPTVAFAWHWPCALVPETRTAWDHYEATFPSIVDRFREQGWRVTGHSHPKWRGEFDAAYTSVGVDVLPQDYNVFREADILIVDNSSLAYEFALLGRPVICLNAPWYRRDVEHGLRFWSHVPGIEINEPEELLAFNLWDLSVESPTGMVSEFRRTQAVEHAYAVRDGSSAQRAAEWITSLVEGV